VASPVKYGLLFPKMLDHTIRTHQLRYSQTKNSGPVSDILTIMPRENSAGILPFKLQIDVRPSGSVRDKSAGSAILKVGTSGEVPSGIMVRDSRLAYRLGFVVGKNEAARQT
jgi:hypothetical protein